MLGIKTAALPASLRRTNQRTVISLLSRMGSASRADLAKAAGISQPTAGKITAELLAMGVLQSVATTVVEDPPAAAGNHTPRLGRPGRMLELDRRKPRFVAIELDVAETRVAALPVGVQPADRWDHSFPTPSSPAALGEQLAQVASRIPITDLWGVLVSVPGIVDEAAGRVLFSPNLHWLEGTPPGPLIQRAWNIPVVLVQEIRALALGHLAAEPGGEDFLLVDFGHGVGGAVVMEGQLYPHPTPLNGEIGHTPVPANLRPCGCGGKGCLETLISRRGLCQSFAAARGGSRRGGGSASDWSRLVAHVHEHGLEPWLEETLETAAKVVAGAINVLGLHHVVLTGTLTEFPESAFARLGEGIQRGALWARFGKVTCQAAPRRRSSGLVAVGVDRLVLPAVEDQPAARTAERATAA